MVSQRIAEHIAGARFEDLPPEAVAAAKTSLLDHIGVSLGASGFGEVVQPFIDLALRAGGPNEATILGTGRKASMMMAALANGALAHALDFEDAHDVALVHPNAQIIPALLALAEARGPVSGAEFLTALAVGCDLVCRLKLASRTDPSDLGWYPPSVTGAMGAAAASARLLGATPAQVIDALSLTLGPAAASAEVKYSPRSHVRAVRDGFSAHAGLLAAQLAVAGVVGYDRPLEGKAGFFALYAGGGFDEAALTGDLGRRFEGANVSYKPFPACRGTHAFIEMALGIRSEGVRPEDIIAIRLAGGPIQEMLTTPHEQRLKPRTAIDAKFSTPFTVGLTFVHGAPTLHDFGPERLAEPDVLRLAALCEIALEPDNGRPVGWGRMSVELANGAVHERQVDNALGHPSNPLSPADMAAKFRRCADLAQRAPSADEQDRLIAAMSTLETAPDAAAAIFS